jgi:hypothetical protein
MSSTDARRLPDLTSPGAHYLMGDLTAGKLAHLNKNLAMTNKD